MQNALIQSSTITAKGQTTIPKPVRQALGVDCGERIIFHVSDDGVRLSRCDTADPAIDAFLGFLADDIAANPQKIEAFTPEMLKRISELTEGMVPKIDDKIEGDVAL